MRSMDTCCVEPEAVEMGKLNVQVQHAAHLVQRSATQKISNKDNAQPRSNYPFLSVSFTDNSPSAYYLMEG